MLHVVEQESQRVLEMFETQAHQNPDRAAVIAVDDQLTYAELQTRAAQLALVLQGRGAGQDRPVGICLERSVWMPVVVLAVLQAGAAFVPLDPSYPKPRLDFMRQDAGVCLIVTQQSHAKEFVGSDVICIDSDWPNINSTEITAPTPDDLFYVIYTSGSTGTPKAVAMPHRALDNLISWQIEVTFSPTARTAQFAALGFDVAYQEIFATLCGGGTLLIVPEPLRRDPRGLVRFLDEHSIERLFLPFVALQQLAEEAGTQPGNLQALREVITAGEQLKITPAIRALFERLPLCTLHNHYGPSETHVATAYTLQGLPKDWPALPPIGRPLTHLEALVLDLEMRPTPDGDEGELYLGGTCLAHGYYGRPELTAERFLPHPADPRSRLYRTGDRALRRTDGEIEFLGRLDSQVKIRGFRVEPGEVEQAILSHPAVAQAAVKAHEYSPGDTRLTAYLTLNKPLLIEELRAFLDERLPDYLVPFRFQILDSLPLTPSGKVDRLALPLPQTGRPDLAAPYATPKRGLEQAIARLWEETLGLTPIGAEDSFFDLGGRSLQLVQVHRRIAEILTPVPEITTLFEYPTVRALVQHLLSEQTQPKNAPRQQTEKKQNDIAIIGMAGRFPGAQNIAEFWDNLVNGVDSITHFTDTQLEAAGIDRETLRQTDYVKARGILEDADKFDAAFFGIPPKEADVLDPQHRIFLESAWEALEYAGYVPETYDGSVGIWAGSSLNTYLLANLCGSRAAIEDLVASYQVGNYPILAGNDKDFLPTRVSYKLNLKGPSLSVGTGCSTSLVAVALACQSLQTFGCDLALAGGVSVAFPQERGYFYEEGGMVSPDGQCRAFDADARGTVFGGGVGVVVLKRLSEAIADGDTVYAVIKGYGLNNDGAQKASYTAPSAKGQADAIRRAQRMAEVSAETVTYIEAHGTATPLGDPIEIAGLTKAFRADTDRKGFCALGSVKPNTGHLEAASGVTGLIKTTLSLWHRQIPPSLNFEAPNPHINFADSPFYVNQALAEWPEGETPRRAGVSSFGVGGTNAHLVLEEAPLVGAKSETAQAWHILPFSARTEAALETITANFAKHLQENVGINLTDAAHTLQNGRKEFAHRRTLVCRSREEVYAALETRDTGKLIDGVISGKERPVTFLFPGQGAQQVNMGRELYETEPRFREAIDECSEILLPLLGQDLRQTLYPLAGQEEAARERLAQTALAQPALFVFGYALARLWMAWGIAPQAMLGHSVGEYVAACLSCVFTLPNALAVLAGRARLMQTLPGGAMLAIRKSAAEIQPLLGDALSLAAVNSPTLCVLSGPYEALQTLEDRLTTEGTACRRLATSHAFHSAMTDAILTPFCEIVASVPRSAPQIPFVSNLTGEWITDAQAISPDYWTDHLRQTVRFADGLGTLLGEPNRLFLEVGPSATLSPFVRQHPKKSISHEVIASLEGDKGRKPDSAALLGSLGRLWTLGLPVSWKQLHSGEENRQRIALPTYPFERTRHWVEPLRETMPFISAPLPLAVLPDSDPVVPSRTSRILHTLQTVLHEQSGIVQDQIIPTATFLDLGFDSLFLTQASRAISNQFGIKITFRNMLEDAPTPEALARFLDQKMPPEATLPPTAIPTVIPTTLPPVPASVGVLEQIVSEQLRLMEKQLELLRGQTPTVALPAPILPPSITTAVPAIVPKAFGPYKPIDAAAGGGLTVHQQIHLDALITRTVQQTPESKRLTQEHRQHLADPRAVAGFKTLWKEMVYPIVAARSAGSKLWDIDGNEFLDVTMGFGVNLLGHSPDFITEAVTKQLNTGVEIGPQSPLAGEVARLVCEMTGTERATFCNTGSEAVMAALRAARTVTGRSKIAYFTGDYHGTFDEVLARSIGDGSTRRSVPISPGIPEGMTAETLILEYGTQETLEILRSQAAELAAILVEPVQSRRPNLQPREFLQELRRITTEAGAALIFDEVITGFRVHPGGAQAWFGVEADIATYGKIIGGGMPMGIVAGKAEYLDVFDGGHWQYGDESWPETGVTFFAGTFIRHPLALAAGKAMLEHLKTAGPSLQETLNAKTAQFVDALNAYCEQTEAPIRLAHFGSVFYPQFAPNLKWASLLFYYLRANGIHIWEGRPCFLSTAHTEDDIEFLLVAFQKSITQMQEGGFLPGTPPTPLRMPLTEPQKEVWMAAQMGENASNALIESLSIHLHGDFDFEAMQRAVQQVVHRHEALRTTFSPTGDFQRIAPALPIQVLRKDLSARQADLAEHLADESRTPFDLENGPLFRAEIMRLDNQHHVLILSAHHLVCDGWSFGIVLNELGALYSAEVAGTSCVLPAPEPFRRYAESLTSETVQSTVQVAENYWKTKLYGPLPRLELPSDRTRPHTSQFQGSRRQRKLSGPLTNDLKHWSAQEGVTLFTALLTGFTVLLQRLSNQDEMIVGIPAAGQSHLDNSCLVGHCVSLLPLRMRGGDAKPFREYLQSVKDLVFEAYDHRGCTWGQILQTLRLGREAGASSPLGVTFNLDRLPPNLRFGNLDWQIETNPRNFYQFDLGFNIVESKDALTVECDYCADIFDAATIDRWLGHFETLLSGMTETPECLLGDLPLLGEIERGQILQWSRQLSDSSIEQCVHTLFEAQVESTPDAIALEFGSACLTYRELNARANSLANYLRTLGVGPETPVAVLAERSLEMVIALLACLKAGGAYVPLDPAYPQARLQFMLDDARPAALLTQQRFNSEKLPFDGPVICLDAEWKDIAAYAETNLPSETTPDSLVCVIYTSGSTGNPKGVAVPHRGVTRLVKNTDYLDFGPSEAVLQLASLSFDASTFEIWSPLLNGGRLVLPPPQTPTLQEISELIRQQGITTAWLTAGLFHAMVDHDIEALRPLRQLIAGGDVLSVAHCRRVRAELPHIRLVNGYGPTECTTFAVCRTLTETDLLGTSVPIGTPIGQTSAYVLDHYRRLVPVGIAGDLWLGGPGLAREYLNLPALTAERFVQHAFEGEAGMAERLYATGDRVQWRQDGTLEFLGRRDEQVKIRGFRVEFGEIEQTLLMHPAVSQAVVIAQDFGPGDKRLAAYIIAKNAPSDTELLQFLSDKLPQFLMPSAFVFLTQIPLTENGKPDRRALPAPEAMRRDTKTTVGEVRDVLEQDLMQIWRELLPASSFGIYDDFFDLGGHSLLALQLFGRIEKQLGIAFPFPTIFQAPTIAQLADRIRRPETTANSHSLLVPIQPQGSKPRLFCIHPDHGLVLFYQELAKQLSPEQPVFGLQAAGLTENQLPHVTIEEIASRYVQEIQAFQSEGPYCLAGYSLGGVIAFEMAHQFRAGGHTVSFLGLLDTYAPIAFQQNLIEKSPLQRTIGHLSILTGLSPKEKWGYLKQKAGEAVYGKKSDRQIVSEELQESLPQEKLEALQRAVIAHEQANFAYSPRPYMGKITLFRAVELDVFEFYDPHLWWTDFCAGGLEVQDVPGSHWTMMKMPKVQALAQALQTSLDEAAH